MITRLPFEIKVIAKKKFLAIFEISGLSPGYGIIIGNSLRSILLSSLEGAAITKFKIKGVQHEFSTIPHILEDVLSIMLNLKQLRFKLHTREQQRIFLKIKGERKIKGEDFQVSTQVEIVNKSIHIATLTDEKAELEIEAWIEKGIGYFAADDKQRKKEEEGVIDIDAVFTPIRKVSFEVEDMRVEKKVDFNRLKIIVETDGTIMPEEALIKASEILNQHFLHLKESLLEKTKKIGVNNKNKKE